ncbi:MAG TPA: Ig-like domain-containing protein, partial [Archangium sp.]|uniref:Ig-like domain-containing protein n=1 Tax=Archangium sp. TaxID=1872627 RepID=UPI002EDA6AE3
TTYTTGAVTSACTVTASFVLNEYTVSTQVAAGQGSFSPNSATVAHGGTTSFTVTPATGYSVQAVTGCGGTLSGTTYTTGAVTSACTVTASFVLNEYTVSTQVAAGQGSFSPNSVTVAHGGTTSFTVTPATGYSVQAVTGCGGILSGTTYTTAAVTSDCTVTASFVLNSSPDAVDDAVTVAEDSGATVVDVLANDSTGEPLTVTAVMQPASGGSVTLEGGVVRFTPAPHFNGPVMFTYTVSDGNGGTDTATVAVMVLAVNDPPTGVADTFSVPAGSAPKTLDVLANDTSAPDTGETLTVAAVTQPASGGTVSVAPNGTGVVFTPTPGFTGAVTFTYTVSDGNGGTAIVTVTVTVGRVDSDNDGIDDDSELELGLDPSDPDADDDGIVDSEDGLTDTDGDDLIDALDPDSDNDGLNDGTERGVTASMALPGTDRSSPNFQPDSDPSTTTDPRNPDSDNDGLKDGTEDANHDGRLDATESDPNDPDTDHGGLRDGDEVSAGGNPRDYTDDLVVAGRGCSSTGSGALLPLLALLAVPLLRRRQALRGSAMGWGVLGLLAAVFVSAPASAQDASQASQSIDVQQYKPGPSSRDVLNLHGSQVGKHLDWNLGLSFNYA